MIFVDTSFWYALVSPDDGRHDDARELYARRRAERLLTSDRVIEELWTLLRVRKTHGRAVWTVSALRASPRLVRRPVTPELAAAAWAWLDRHDERVYSFVDASSFAMMRAGDLAEVLAFDGDFSAAGFVELRV